MLLSLHSFAAEEENMPVREISDALVFADEHYFCTIFKEKCGMTPGQFRQNRGEAPL